MANFTASRPGADNNGVDPKALFLTIFGGEVLTAFRRKTVFRGRFMERNIQSGKTAQFPATWKAAASYHTPGTQLTGQVILSSQRTIGVDDLLTAPVFIPNIDEAMSHFEFRKEYSFQCGEALAQVFDQNVARNVILAARASATLTGGNGGTAIVSATAATNMTNLVSAILDGLQALDEKDVPESERAIFVRPAQYWNLIDSNHAVMDRDFGGAGSVGEGKIPMIGGVPLYKSNNIPSTDQSADATIPTAYRGNYSTTIAAVAHKGAVGTVKLMDLSVQSDYLIEYQGTLIVARYSVGHGILRPECAVEIKSA